MNRGCVVMAALWLLCVPNDSGAVTTDIWRVSGSTTFLAADLESLSVSSEGIVSPAPAFLEVPEFSADYVWSLAAGSDGKLWAGTGSGGQLFRVDSNAAHLVYDSVALQIESIAVGRDGTVYAGTTPDATIFAITKDGTARTFVDLPERHVWSLGIDASGQLLAATGDRARLYRIDASGNPKVIHEGKGDHFTSMIVRDRDVLLGSGEGGLLLAVDDAGRARVLMDADEDEVKALVAGPDGALYAAVNPVVGGPAPGKNGDAAAPKKAWPTLYRIRDNEVVESVWKSPESFIQALAVDGNGRLYAATGGGESGGVYRIDPATGDWALLSRPGPPQILSLAVAGDALCVGTGSPGKIYRGGIAGSPVGRLTSEVRDMKQVSDWGVLRWERFDAGSPGSISFRTRSGNAEKPDETWSDWSSSLTNPDGSQVTSPAGRFIQWRAEFKGGGKGGPALREVTMASLARNRAPRLTAFDVSPPGVILGRGGDSGPQPVIQSFPGNVRAEFSVSSQAGRGPATDEEAAWVRRYRTLRWEAVDPNDDPLEFRIEYRGESETVWRPLKKDLKDPIFVFDSSDVPDGVYRFRVTATDASRNPPGESLEATRETDFIVVDNTPPAIDGFSALLDGEMIKVTAKLSDRLSPLKLAEISFDGEVWRPVHPVDRIMDELDEEIRVDVDRTDRESLTLLIRVSDQAGNVGLARAGL